MYIMTFYYHVNEFFLTFFDRFKLSVTIKGLLRGVCGRGGGSINFNKSGKF